MAQQQISGIAARIGKQIGTSIGTGLLAATLALSGCGAEYKPTTNPCITLEDLHIDAYGRDNQFLNGEYLLLGNSCNTPLPLAGWSVEDDDGNHYNFPSRELQPTGHVCLRSGSGVDSAHNLYWKSNGRPIWNNDKDTVRVFDKVGNLMLEYAYDFRERR